MTAQNAQSRTDGEGRPEIFDRVHLSHYTMHNAELEREILGLFLAQLPETVASIQQADSAAEWRLATHTLKGSCAAVGARRLHEIAQELEVLGVEGDRQVRDLRLQVLQAAVAEFRHAVRDIHP